MVASVLSSTSQHPITLSFRDSNLERQYLDELVGPSQQRMRSGTVAGTVLWLAAGVVADVVVGIEPAVAYTVAVGLALINVIAFLLVSRSSDFTSIQIVGAVVNASAILFFFWLVASGGTFELYAAVGAMLIATFSFVVIQLRFVVSLALTAIYVILFISISVSVDSTATFTQSFIFASALLMGSIGVRNLENSARAGFTQRIEIAALHDQVQRLLRTYLSPSVADVMLADPTISDLGGQVSQVTVMFADLEGFTPMSRTMAPSDVASILNRYFEVVVPTVIAEGGSVLSFGGDAVVAVFNVPDPYPDHACRAMRSALRIQEAIERLRSEDDLQDAPSFRIGINTGEAFVGNIGSDETRTFTIIGEAVNLAARLQTHATPGMVLIGPATYEAAADKVRAEPLPMVHLKGITDPIQPYRLLAVI